MTKKDCYDNCKYQSHTDAGFTYCKKFKSENPWAWDKCKGKFFKVEVKK